MKTGLITTTMAAASLSMVATLAQAHPAGGTHDLAHGLNHLFADPSHGLLHVISLAGIAASVAAGVFVARRILRLRRRGAVRLGRR